MDDQDQPKQPLQPESPYQAPPPITASNSDPYQTPLAPPQPKPDQPNQTEWLTDDTKPLSQRQLKIVLFVAMLPFVVGSVWLFVDLTTNDHRPPYSNTQIQPCGQNNQTEQPAMDEPFDAKTSPNIPTVREVRSCLAERGFNLVGMVDYARVDTWLSVDFDINGEYLSSVDIEKDSDDRYPSYTAFYTPPDNEITWLLYINNGSYFARPIFLGDTDTGIKLPVEVIVSEASYITGYDGRNNTFKRTIPDSDELIIKQVKRIDKATLDALTLDELLESYDGEVLKYGDSSTKVQPTQEDIERITEASKKIIDEDFPDYKGIEPHITVSVEGDSRIVYAEFVNTPGVVRPGIEINRFIIIHIDQDGKVGVAQSN
ncbi:hypothetical protein FWF93_03195 [Candidatus Saccharibacteria bacterium]|nr:hypothetical protein [Candidatus Saccharibacteria bacterium]